MDILFGRNQFPVFVSFLICGVIAGIIYDLLKIKRRIFGAPYIVLFFDDIIFMLVCSVVVVFNLYSFNNGNIKWYEIPFMLTGLCVYRMTLSVIFIKICFYIIDTAKKIVWKIILPIKKAALWLFCRGSILFEKVLLAFVMYRCKSRIVNSPAF